MPARLAIAPGSWGVEPPGDPGHPPYGSVLDEIAAAGFRNVELGPVGYLPEEPARLREELGGRGLQLVAGYAMEPFHDAAAEAETLAIVERTCRVLAGGGATRLVLIEALVPGRSRTVARAEEAERLDEAGWEQLVAALSRAAEIAAGFGLASTFHPHAGTFVEFRDEVDRVLSALDPETVGLCVDTGHALLASIDPRELIASYGQRVDHIHLKDVDIGALEQLRAERASFEQMVARDVFTPLGQGSVDFTAVAETLTAIGFDGAATIEQDRLIGDPAALADARASFQFAAAAGFSGEQASPRESKLDN